MFTLLFHLCSTVLLSQFSGIKDPIQLNSANLWIDPVRMRTRHVESAYYRHALQNSWAFKRDVFPVSTANVNILMMFVKMPDKSVSIKKFRPLCCSLT